MAKRAPGKKMSRRVKRTIRKSLSAVFMITALVVAAIPVQNNVEAADITGEAGDATPSTLEEEPAIEYDVTANNNISNLGLALGSATQKDGYVITALSDSYRLDKIYKVARIGDTTAIVGYNTDYIPDGGTLVIPENVVASYSDFDDTDVLSVYNYENEDGLEALQKRYDQWYKDNVTVDPDNPSIITRKVDISLLPPGQQLTYARDVYACDQVNDAGYVAQEVITGSNEDGTNITAFIPRSAATGEFYTKLEDKYNITAIADDAFSANTFSSTGTTGSNTINVSRIEIPASITKIGNGAFKNVSALTSIKLGSGIKTVGNHTFEGCSGLVSIEINNLEIIGAEAFKDCTSLTSISLPTSVNEIGPGAFYNCSSLSNVDMGKISARNVIDKFAFYNCPSISTVTFSSTTTRIDDGVFSVPSTSAISGSWTNIVFPDSVAELGDAVLDGRTNLQTCTLPSSYGATQATSKTLNAGFFRQCMNLQWVKVGGEAIKGGAFVTIPENTFVSITNENFYIEGPATNNGSNDYKNESLYAAPRSSAHAAGITYKFTVNGISYFEVAYSYIPDGEAAEVTDYYLINTSNGALEEYRPQNPTGDVEIVIKGNYNGVSVTSVAEGCFDEVKDRAVSLLVEDNTISALSDNAFKGFSKLKTVTLGNSITAIGAGAFQDCSSLEDVYFRMDSVTIGENAFETNTDNGLTFHGKIAVGYAPFDWAMQRSNDITDRGTRVLYKSLSPTDLAAIYDKGQSTDDSDVVTLMYYPLYGSLDKDNAAYCRGMEEYYYSLYGSHNASYDANRDAYLTAGTAEEKEALYGPWIDETYADDNGLTSYFDAHPYSITENYERGAATDVSQPWLYASDSDVQYVRGATEIIVPAGITSIDSPTYYNSTGNNPSILAYINSSDDGSSAKEVNRASMYSEEDSVPGLFSGYYDDYSIGGIDDNPKEIKELEVKGNDYITRVDLNTVTSLPDYAFDSCESLSAVKLGAVSEIGISPFRGCTSLTAIEGNEKFVYSNGILYSVNSDGSYTLEQCIPSRGISVGDSTISNTTDPNLNNVSAISESAFSTCPGITIVDLSDCTFLKTLPKDCFKNCKAINAVYLPDSVTTIESGAFEGNTKFTVRIPATEVLIKSDAFNHNDTSILIETYEDTAARRYADNYGLTWVPLEEGHCLVRFLDWDFTELYSKSVLNGSAVIYPNDNPTRSGYKFDGWRCLTSGMTLDNITASCIWIAQYVSSGSGGNGGGGNGSISGNGDGNGNNNNNNNNNGTLYTVTVNNGSGSGSYAQGATVIITANNPASGYQFKNWTTTNTNITLASTRLAATTFTMPAGNVTVTANYEKSSSNGGNSNNNNNNSGSSSVSGNSSSNNNNGTKVIITRPGISDTDLASAKVNGSNGSYIVKISETAEATAAVEEALINKYGSLENLRYCAMDISLYDSTGTTKITDTTGYTIDITIPLPDSLKEYGGNNKTAAVVGTQLESLTPKFSSIDGVPCVTFRATHFSPYTVYVDTNNLSASGNLDNTPKTGDGIHPKWFLSIGLACLSIALFMKKDKKTPNIKIA